MERADAGEGKAAVLLLDLDRFRRVNESLGQGARDRLLQVMAERIAGCLETAQQPRPPGQRRVPRTDHRVRRCRRARRAAQRILDEIARPVPGRRPDSCT